MPQAVAANAPWPSIRSAPPHSNPIHLPCVILYIILLLISTLRATSRMIAGAVHLAEKLNEVPAIIFVCGPMAGAWLIQSRASYPPNAPIEQSVWSAPYAAAQNLIVAARSLGLGTTFTTFQMFMESELRELLGIPKEIKFGVMIPIGWPKDDFVKVTRKPISEVIHWDKWSD